MDNPLLKAITMAVAVAIEAVVVCIQRWTSYLATDNSMVQLLATNILLELSATDNPLQ